MIYNPYLFWWNPIPELDLRPPTIYAFLNSIVNYDSEVKTKISDLAKIGRTEIFDFEYPLTNNMTKEFFETQILNHYMMRRIGFETMTAFKLQLNCKLNEIMPVYNRMFDALEDWNIFDSEVTERIGEDIGNSESTSNSNTKMVTASSTSSSGTEDRRRSDTPQSELENVRDGSYVTNYEYNQNSNNSNDSSDSTGTNESSGTNKDHKNYSETIRRSPTASEKIAIYNQMQTNIFSIFRLIYNELDSLFYGIV